MNIKLGIFYGVLIWIITYILSFILNPARIMHTTYSNLIIPLIIIVVTGFFGILYIREINRNEVIEGFLVGIIFIIINVSLNLLTENLHMAAYHTPVIVMSVIMILITTFLGYLSQMRIELK